MIASKVILWEDACTIFTPTWVANKNFFFYLEKEEEEEEEEVTQEEKENVKLHALVSVFQFIMKQSYICALIAMMVSTSNKKNAADFMKMSLRVFLKVVSLVGFQQVFVKNIKMMSA